MIVNNTTSLLEFEEGKKSTVYLDTEGYQTIGVGFCVDGKVKGAGLTNEEIDAITDIRIGHLHTNLGLKYPWFDGLDLVRQAVVISMVWELGNISSWPKFLAAIDRQDYNATSQEMLASTAARQAPARWSRQARTMMSGNWSAYDNP